MEGYDYDQLFPGRFLKSGEFGGRDVTLKVSKVEIEELPDKKGTKVNKEGERVKVRGIISFTSPNGRPVEKQLVLNRTNGECFKALWGRKTSDWIGKLVTFYPAQVEAFGEQTTAIRVRGSPELEKPLTFDARIGRNTVKVTLRPTGKTNGKTPPPPEPEPTSPEATDEFLDELEGSSASG